MVSNWPVCILRVSKRLSVMLLCDWAEKSKRFLAPIRSQSYSVWNWSAKTPRALSFVLDFSSPEIFLVRLDFVPPLLTALRSVSRPFRNEWVSKGEFVSYKVKCKIVVFFLRTRATWAVFERKVWSKCRNGEEGCGETPHTRRVNYAYGASRLSNREEKTTVLQSTN